MYYNPFTSKSCVSFENKKFMKGFISFGGENKTKVCFAKIERMIFYNN
jgi:hypothetical protein